MNESISTQPNYKPILVAILCVLVVSLIFNVYSVISSRPTEEQQQALELYDEIQSDIILNLFEDYQDTAYGPKVERIAEQQLIATEYTLQAQQIIALQNSIIIDLLAVLLSMCRRSWPPGFASWLRQRSPMCQRCARYWFFETERTAVSHAVPQSTFRLSEPRVLGR